MKGFKARVSLSAQGKKNDKKVSLSMLKLGNSSPLSGLTVKGLKHPRKQLKDLRSILGRGSSQSGDASLSALKWIYGIPLSSLQVIGLNQTLENNLKTRGVYTIQRSSRSTTALRNLEHEVLCHYVGVYWRSQASRLGLYMYRSMSYCSSLRFPRVAIGYRTTSSFS